MGLCTLLSGCGPDALAPSAPPAISFSVVSGNGQSGVAGQELPAALAVKAVDNQGNPIADLTVNFRVTSGGGSVYAGVAVTNANGVAREYWTLGTSTSQAQILEVRAVKPNGVKQLFGTFTATALAGAPAQITLVAGDGQTASAGSMVPIAPAVRVNDQYGNPVPATSVTFAIGSGGGSITGGNATTNAGGIATVGSWTLGAAGANSLTAIAAGVSPVTFNATATQVVSGWQARASMPAPRWGLGVGVVNGIVYAVGGLNNDPTVNTNVASVVAYDPTTGFWTTRAPLPTPRYNLSVSVVSGILYAIGGVNSSGNVVGTVEAYDPTTNQWTPKASMPTARHGHAAGVVNGIIYAVGGSAGNWQGTVEAYDPGTDSWTTKASMPTARYYLSVAVTNGILYAVGGFSFTGVASVEAYDPTSNSWTPRAALPAPRFQAAIGVANGILYLVGGGDDSGLLGTAESYDPATNSWTNQTPLPTSRRALAVGAVNGVIYAVGGNVGGPGNGPVATVEALFP